MALAASGPLLLRQAKLASQVRVLQAADRSTVVSKLKRLVTSRSLAVTWTDSAEVGPGLDFYEVTQARTSTSNAGVPVYAQSSSRSTVLVTPGNSPAGSKSGDSVTGTVP